VRDYEFAFIVSQIWIVGGDDMVQIGCGVVWLIYAAVLFAATPRTRSA
jgi:hypothetical protein